MARYRCHCGHNSNTGRGHQAKITTAWVLLVLSVLTLVTCGLAFPLTAIALLVLQSQQVHCERCGARVD